MLLQKHLSTFVTDVDHLPPAVVAKQAQRFLECHTPAAYLHEVIWVSIGHNQVEEPVVVIIKETQAPPAKETRSICDTGALVVVIKGIVAVVMVDREGFLINVGHE